MSRPSGPSTELTHYNAVLEVIEAEHGCSVVWTTDFLPDAAEPLLSELQAQALAAMRRQFGE